MKPWILAALLPMASLMAQVPGGWDRREPLASGATPWWGVGLWAADGQGPPATLINSLGMGNGLTGAGFHLEGGIHAGNWDFAGEVLGNRDFQGAAYLTLYRSHAWWHGPSGWQFGYEQEPLVWGYGLNGGYLLGESDRPVPKLRIESPMRHLGIGRVGLGTWGFQAFMGRLENDRQLSSSMQDLAWRQVMIAQNGDPQSPMLAGYRVQAQFGAYTEFYANYLNLFAGTRDGVAMTQGYGLGDYATAMFGLKDALAESGINFTDPNHPAATYVNKARSASNADLGFRVRVPYLEKALAARDVRVYLSRGSKGVTMTYGLFLKDPLHWLASDVSTDLKHIVQGHLSEFWYENNRKSIPNMVAPNDTIGILASWPGIRLGVEYQDTSNPSNSHRSFASEIYLSGFYYHGDPLGEAMGGEARTSTVHLEWDLRPNLASGSWLLVGDRPFRDDLVDWQAQYPGAVPGRNRYYGLQQTLAWKIRNGVTLDLGASWMHNGAVDFVSGRDGNGCRWFTDLSFRWPKA